MAAAGYFERRFKYGKEKKMSGYTARISRGADIAFDTPNELNLFAFSKFMDNDGIFFFDIFQNK